MKLKFLKANRYCEERTHGFWNFKSIKNISFLANWYNRKNYSFYRDILVSWGYMIFPWMASLEAVSKCPCIEEKYSKTVWKLIVFPQANEICRHHYSSKKISKEALQFSASIIELTFQSIGFFTCHFFVFLSKKLAQMLILTLFTRISGNLIENRQTLFDFWSQK